jgi:hypothetical protein
VSLYIVSAYIATEKNIKKKPQKHWGERKSFACNRYHNQIPHKTGFFRENVYLKCEQNVSEYGKIYEITIMILLKVTKNINNAQKILKKYCKWGKNDVH